VAQPAPGLKRAHRQPHGPGLVGFLARPQRAAYG